MGTLWADIMFSAVYEIMLKWLECKDWNQAFLEVIPQRKFKDFNASKQPNSAAGEDSSDGEAVNEGSDIGATPQEDHTVTTSLEEPIEVPTQE
jgi:hypothetical protein